ncbi:MAG: hypothetical protein ACYSU0_02715 [Planctomycetota bacterium]|jgi:hypothetical protein
MNDEDAHSESEFPPPERIGETETARICSLIVFALALLASAQVLYMVLALVPILRDFFEEVGPDFALPVMTMVVLSPAFRTTVVLLALASIVKEFTVKNRRTTLVINGVHLLAAFAAQWLVTAALLRPLIDLMKALGE